MLYHVTFRKGGAIQTGRVYVAKGSTTAAEHRQAKREASWKYGVTVAAVTSAVRCGGR